MRFPTEDFIVFDSNFAIHRSQELWPRVTEFIPERWMITDEKDPLYPPRNAWRGFEQGPRNCPGQYLAVAEMKMVMALALPVVDIECAWAEWDALK